MYVGFQCFIIFNAKEIYGPYNPTLGSPSDPALPSAHAEVVATNSVRSLKNKNIYKYDKLNDCFKNATLALIHWTYNKDMDDWILSDGVPCYDCVKFCEMNKFREFIISTKDDTKIKKVNLEYLKKNTKKSTGRLYSSGNKY